MDEFLFNGQPKWFHFFTSSNLNEYLINIFSIEDQCWNTISSLILEEEFGRFVD